MNCFPYFLKAIFYLFLSCDCTFVNIFGILYLKRDPYKTCFQIYKKKLRPKTENMKNMQHIIAEVYYFVEINFVKAK